LAKGRERSLNFIALEALLRYVEKEEEAARRFIPD